MSNSDLRTRLPVIGFLAGTAVSLLGNAMAAIALPWFVLQTTGSASQTGFVAMAGTLPAVLSGVFGGPLVDYVGGKRMSIIADSVSAISVLLIPIFYHADMLSFPLLLALVFMGALLDIPGITGRRMLLPSFQRRSGWRSEQMNSAFELLTNGAFMVGPVMAGILISMMGAVNLLWITAAGFAVSTVAVFFAAEDVPRSSDVPKSNYLDSVREGVRFIASTPILISLALVSAFSNFVANAFFAVGLPVFVNDTWGTATRLGLLFTTLGVGTLAGVTFFGMFGHRLRAHRRALILVWFITQPIWLTAFVWSESLPVLMIAMFLIGLAAGPANPLSVGVRFEHIPKPLQGRVFAAFSAIAGLITPIGIGLGGWLFERYEVQTAMLVIVICSAAGALVVPFLGGLRQMNEPGPFADELN